MTLYYRPVPVAHGRHRLAGGWTRFSQVEVLQRGQSPSVTDDIPAEVLERLTTERQMKRILSLTDSFSRRRILTILQIGSWQK